MGTMALQTKLQCSATAEGQYNCDSWVVSTSGLGHRLFIP